VRKRENHSRTVTKDQERQEKSPGSERGEGRCPVESNKKKEVRNVHPKGIVNGNPNPKELTGGTESRGEGEIITGE